jgi:hypothetical protein
VEIDKAQSLPYVPVRPIPDVALTSQFAVKQPLTRRAARTSGGREPPAQRGKHAQSDAQLLHFPVGPPASIRDTLPQQALVGLDYLSVNVLVHYRKTALNRLGAEWLTDAQVDQYTHLYSEFFQRLSGTGGNVGVYLLLDAP